jgi:hypothetical protein
MTLCYNKTLSSRGLATGAILARCAANSTNENNLGTAFLREGMCKIRLQYVRRASSGAVLFPSHSRATRRAASSNAFRILKRMWRHCEVPAYDLNISKREFTQNIESLALFTRGLPNAARTFERGELSSAATPSLPLSDSDEQ